MAVLVLQLGPQFGDAAAECWNEHQRVVAKASRAARRLKDFSLPSAHRDQRLGVVGRTDGHQCADKSRAAIAEAVKAFDQQAVVRSILNFALLFSIPEGTKMKDLIFTLKNNQTDDKPNNVRVSLTQDKSP